MTRLRLIPRSDIPRICALTYQGTRLTLFHMNNETEDSTLYKVVVNHEEQYSIWPDYKDIPAGWRAIGFSGTKAACLAKIEEVWTDMRPLSLRKKMEG